MIVYNLSDYRFCSSLTKHHAVNSCRSLASLNERFRSEHVFIEKRDDINFADQSGLLKLGIEKVNADGTKEHLVAFEGYVDKPGAVTIDVVDA